MAFVNAVKLAGVVIDPVFLQGAFGLRKIVNCCFRYSSMVKSKYSPRFRRPASSFENFRRPVWIQRAPEPPGRGSPRRRRRRSPEGRLPDPAVPDKLGAGSTRSDIQAVSLMVISTVTIKSSFSSFRGFFGGSPAAARGLYLIDEPSFYRIGFLFDDGIAHVFEGAFFLKHHVRLAVIHPVLRVVVVKRGFGQFRGLEDGPAGREEGRRGDPSCPEAR